MVFHRAAAAPVADVERVISSLRRVRVVICVRGSFPPDLLYSSTPMGRKNRASVVSALGIDGVFPSVYILPPRAPGGSRFHLVSGMVCPEFADRLCVVPGARVHLVGNRVATVCLEVECLLHVLSRVSFLYLDKRIYMTLQ